MLRCLAQAALGKCMVRNDNSETLPGEEQEFCLRCIKDGTCPLAERLCTMAVAAPAPPRRRDM